MPSDPSGHNPSGVLVRPAPDFFDDNMGMGGFAIISGAGVHFFFHQISLYNNATTGIALKVYGVGVLALGGSGVWASFLKGPQGAFQSNCSALRPDLPTPTGQIYYQQAIVPTGTPNPFFPAAPLALLGAPGADTMSYFSPFPMFIVPAGWSLCLTNLETSDDGGASFWYQQANE